MTGSELSSRLARPADATTIANLSRSLIEYVPDGVGKYSERNNKKCKTELLEVPLS